MSVKKQKKGFKWLKEDLRSDRGDLSPWKLGEWRKHGGEPKLCESGFHFSVTALDSLEYAQDRLFYCEARGKIVVGGDKSCATELRVVREVSDAKRKIQLFAIACAERALVNYEKVYANDTRPRDAIQAAKDFLCKKITKEQLDTAESAAWSAAWSAGSAARSAAESAAWSAAWSARSAAESAWSAARSAAESARSAESAWQNKKLNEILRGD